MPYLPIAARPSFADRASPAYVAYRFDAEVGRMRKSPSHSSSAAAHADRGEGGNGPVSAVTPSNFALPIVDDEDLEDLLGRAFEDAVGSMEGPWKRGDLTPEKIEQAVRLHRASRPYRRDR